MAAPDYVPTDSTQKVRSYSSPPRRPDAWKADRPGDLAAGQPTGRRLGTQGPDAGYAYKLLNHFEDDLQLGKLHREDIESGCVAIAMKRAALFGRGPVVHDLTAAFSVFGFLDADTPTELVKLREEKFAEIANSHHYKERREVVDLVSNDALMMPHGAIVAAARRNWRSNFEKSILEGH